MSRASPPQAGRQSIIAVAGEPAGLALATFRQYRKATRYNLRHGPVAGSTAVSIVPAVLRSLLILICLLQGPQAAAATAAAATLQLPDRIDTFADGRRPIEALYASYLSLVEQGWTLEIVARSHPEGTKDVLPIIALLSPGSGAAVWILAGIHGEEPAGPNAIFTTIGDIARLGRQRPVVLLPLLNPQGYARNWRYLNIATFSDTVDGQSVGDSSHLLPSPSTPAGPRAPLASSPEADAVTDFVLRHSGDYPPLASIDLHEDNLIDAGYVYSQGARGAEDPLAIEAVGVLRDNGIAIKSDGETRFGEKISGGIIGPVLDSSIDELIGNPTIICGGRIRPGPAAHTVLVFETPAAEASLERRIAAHAALLRLLVDRLGVTGP